MIKHITRNDIPDDNTGMIINELIDAINKLQEHRESQAKENSLVYEEIEKLKSCLETPAVDNHTIDSLLLQVSQHQEAIDDMSIQISQLWNTGFSNIEKLVDNQTARHESYSPHLIRDTATDPNVGTKIPYSKEIVEQEAEVLMRENDAYRAGMKYALERIKELAGQDYDVSREKQILPEE